MCSFPTLDISDFVLDRVIRFGPLILIAAVPDAPSLQALLQGAGLSVRICDFGCSEVGEAPDHRN